jgi:hypothetical protein
MPSGRILGYIALCVGSLLGTLTSASADHFMAGGGRYSLTSNTSETAVRFGFLGVASSRSETFVPVIQTTIRCTIAHQGASESFRLFMSGTELEPFTVERTAAGAHRVTITGRMRTQLVLRVGPEPQRFTEIATFRAVGLDVALPGAGRDAFTLTLRYSARRDIGPLLLEALGAELVTCNADTCTLRVTGTLTDGEIEGHTSGGE